MRILYYNWIQFDNEQNQGGGVNIYQRNIIDYLIKNIGNNNFNVVFKVFLSNEEDKEILIYKFILYSLKYKEKTL